MNLSGLFVRRPVMTTLLTLAVVLFGLMSYRRLPVSDLPSVDFPTILVSASLPGASPETMAAAVATPLERQFSTISGISAMTSSSSRGSTSITLQFDLSRNIDAAAEDVQAAISNALGQLPRDMLPPSYRKVNPAASPILYLGLRSATLPLSTLNEYGQTLMAQQISMVLGVAQVLVFGAQKYAVRVQVDPRRLASAGIGIDEVAAAIRAGNVEAPTGTLWGPHRARSIEATGELTDAAAFRSLVVTYRDGAPVRLQDLGRVIDSVQNDKVASWVGDRRAIVLAIQRQPGANTVAVARAVLGILDRLEAELPAGVDVEVLYDRSVSIQQSLTDVKYTLLLTFGLVVGVIFLFLRNVSATAIPSLALPVSVIGTFTVMYLAGYSIDNLSLMALILSMGFVVDDAIVMLENIVRHLEMGKPPLRAAEEGSREISFTILSMTLSLAAVFIPLVFMGGIVGRLFREFSVTIGVAVLVSGFVSLTLTPMLCSRFLKPPGEARHGRLYAASEKVFQAALRAYQKSLSAFVRHRRSALVFSALVLVGTFYLFTLVPKGFLPSEDNSQIFGITEAEQGISFEAMANRQQAVAAVIGRDPNTLLFMSAIGAGGLSRSMNQGIVFVHLVPPSKRKLGVEGVIRELSAKLAKVPGIRVFLQNPPSIRIGGRLTKSLYQYTLTSPNLKALYAYAPKLEDRMRSIPGLVGVTSDLLLDNPQVTVEIARERAASFGVTADQIESALGYAYGEEQVSTIYTPTNEYWVILEVLPKYQRDPEALRLLHLRSSDQTLVPLGAVGSLKETLGPVTVNHSGQLPAVTLSFNLLPGASIGAAVRAVEREAQKILPPSVTGSFSGTAQAFQSSQAGLLVLLVFAVLVIYMVLGILYESFIHPITILSGLPFAGFGALLTLLLFGRELDVYSFVGIIMLVGIVKKNAIMMVDFALDAERREGRPPLEAILEACSVRFRPIMMTTLAALMGVLPIAVGFGAGAESRRPLGLAVVGGLAFSQFVTLYVTPVFYTYLDEFQGWLGRRRARG